MRRGNIRIVGIEERPESSSPKELAKVIKEALQMDRDIKIDRSHRTLAPRKPGDRPGVIVTKLHHDGDAEIPRQSTSDLQRKPHRHISRLHLQRCQS